MAMQSVIEIRTSGPGLIEFTDRAEAFVGKWGPDTGLLTVFVRHTTCSLLIQENADSDVQADLHTFFGKLVPAGNEPGMYWLSHTAEGPDDMPAHIKAALTQTSLTIPVNRAAMMLGIWQGLYLSEHRERPAADRLCCICVDPDIGLLFGKGGCDVCSSGKIDFHVGRFPGHSPCDRPAGCARWCQCGNCGQDL
jgi:secondary thiamine-phosphate synthase enzyme